MKKPEKHNHKIRPAARIINTLGKGLIKDDLAAIIELVKNSYDADSESVIVNFEHNENSRSLTISVEDCGHGMNPETIMSKWLVPGTSDKLIRDRSPKKNRKMQGRKGIGRYAAGILGNELFLSTTDEGGQKTELLMDWEDIASHAYLDEVDVLVETSVTNESSGTYIEARNNLVEDGKPVPVSLLWPDSKLAKLKTELSKLVSPFHMKSKDKFQIVLKVGNFPSETWANSRIEIEPLPLLDLYDYRIHGSVTKAGNVTLTYENVCYTPTRTEKIKFKMPSNSSISGENKKRTSYGRIGFDLRVFDRDPEAIAEIVDRARISNNLRMNKTEIKRWLNEFNGVGVYRSGFRVRPYGDKEFDWLNLGSRRVDIPAVRIGSNQVIGLVDIETEELSGLEEKSARDGLVENEHYTQLKRELIRIIEVLERKRYDFRSSSGRGRKLVDIDRVLESLFNFDDLAEDVSTKLEKLGVSKKDVAAISDQIIQVKEEKAKELEDIKETIAFYQGQANLGKMVGHILHEGRKPTSYLRNSLPELNRSVEKLAAKPGDKRALSFLQEEAPFLMEETDKIHGLFSSLDPFTYKRGERSRNHKLLSLVQKAVKVFSSELNRSGIEVDIDIERGKEVYGRATDLYWIFTNIIENSIYWINYENSPDKKIEISSEENEQYQVVRVYDSGPGVPDEHLESGKIFEPGISMKENGTGMGLSTAGELARRNSGDIWAKSESIGVSFYVRLPRNKEVV